jgi:hypothetical protein
MVSVVSSDFFSLFVSEHRRAQVNPQPLFARERPASLPRQILQGREGREGKGREG